MLRETEAGGKQHQPSSRKGSATANLIRKQLCSTEDGRSESSSGLLKGWANCIVLRMIKITHSEKQNSSCPNFVRKIIINLGDFSIFFCLHVCVCMCVFTWVELSLQCFLNSTLFTFWSVENECQTHSSRGDGALFCLSNQIIYNNIFFQIMINDSIDDHATTYLISSLPLGIYILPNFPLLSLCSNVFPSVFSPRFGCFLRMFLKR